MNTAGQLGSTLTSLAFGYLVTAYGGNYNAPLVPMAAMTAISALLWLKIDPSIQLIPEEESYLPTHQPKKAAA